MPTATQCGGTSVRPGAECFHQIGIGHRWAEINLDARGPLKRTGAAARNTKSLDILWTREHHWCYPASSKVRHKEPKSFSI